MKRLLLLLTIMLLSASGFAQQLSFTESVISNLSEQLRLAGTVQRDFLPSELPQTEKLGWSIIYQPAEWVSGDIYDVCKIDESHVGFYIADAVGHSMPAALRFSNAG